MEQLIRFELDYEPTFAYFFDCLDQVNELSKQLISLVDFKSGKFFTILDKNTQQINLYGFKYGGVSKVARRESEDIVYNIISSNPHVSVWFDDYYSKYLEGYHEEIFLKYGMHYNTEVYYQIIKKDLNLEALTQCFRYSNTIWHSLCVISHVKIPLTKKELCLEQIKQICLDAQLILICAYDAEGYVFWERSNEYHSFISDAIS